MNKIIHTLCAAIVALLVFTSCTETETYAEQKEREESAITAYIHNNNITIISEDQFKAQGETTSLENNEYVFFKSSGIYMQIVDKGCGEKLKNGESADVLCRFTEYNINNNALQLTNEGGIS